jgi:nicotinamidase-related amidase
MQIQLLGSVLVVVDMERGYRRSMNSQMYGAVKALIRYARGNDWLIVFLEYLDEGTMPRLLKLVRGYDCFSRVQKQQLGGAPEVLKVCERNRWGTKKIVVCGVDTHECVKQTVTGLSAALPDSRIQVVTAACGTRTGKSWAQFPRACNIHLVGDTS